MSGSQDRRYAILPLTSAVLFPYSTIDLQVTRARNIRLVQEQLKDNQEFVLVRATPAEPDHIRTENLAPVGVTGRIIRNLVLPNGSLQITVEGISRVRIGKFTQTEPYFVAEAERLVDVEEVTPQIEDLAGLALTALRDLLDVDPHYARETGQNFEIYASHPGQLADLLGAEVHFPIEVKQRLLESIPWTDRLNRVIKYLKTEAERAEVAEEFVARTRRSLTRERRELYLRQQLKEIRRELGEDDPQEREFAEVQHRVSELSIPEPVARQIMSEAQRLRLISTASAEYGSTRSFLDWALALPWAEKCDETIPIAHVERTLHERFVGIQRVKEQLLDYLAVRRKVGARSILVLVGPSGVGKTAVGEAIAETLKQPFLQLNVGGAASDSDILGHRRTFLGAQPGMFVRAIREAGVCNPVIMVDNIDRITDEYSRGAVAAALLTALHPVRNTHFVDRFLGFPIDLSKVLFIATAEDSDEIPDGLMDDLDIIEMPGYIEPEKINIVQKHLIPELLDRYQLSAFELNITTEGLRSLIRGYTMEAGLTELTRNLETIFRKCIRQKESGYATQWTIAPDTIGSFLGTPLYIPEAPEARPEIGVAMGLAWTQAGGDLMLIEGLRMAGSGQVVYTGSLGEVMKESVQAAYSYVRAKADMLKIDPEEFGNSDVHIHFPSGAIPKDGPSAGVTVSLVIASVMSNRPIRHDLAMTGEVTLRGKVIAVGGLKEKVAAASRAGISEVIVPRENEKDLQEIPDEIRRSMTFHMVERVDEVFARALLAPETPVVSLEAMLKQEVARVKRRERKKKSASTKKRSSSVARRRKTTNRRKNND